MIKGVTMIRISGKPILSAVSTASKGIPIRKNRTLFVMKPR
jgi:hypothetical protein